MCSLVNLTTRIKIIWYFVDSWIGGKKRNPICMTLLVSSNLYCLLFFRCPRNWVRYIQSCYKFTRSPIKRWDDARLQCQAYRHQDSDNSGMKLTIKFHTIYPVTYGSPISGSKKCHIINSNKFEFGIVYGGIFAKNLLLHYAKSVIWYGL